MQRVAPEVLEAYNRFTDIEYYAAGETYINLDDGKEYKFIKTIFTPVTKYNNIIRFTFCFKGSNGKQYKFRTITKCEYDETIKSLITKEYAKVYKVMIKKSEYEKRWKRVREKYCVL